VTGVRAVDKDGQTREFHAPITIDASGRDAFFITRNGWKIRDPYLNKIAVWTYYKGAQRDPGVDEGATTVAYVPEKGWFWYIPLAGDVVSVGVVAEKDYLMRGAKDKPKDLKEIFYQEVAQNVWIQDHLAVGEQFGPFRITGEYSYRSRYCASDGLLLAGDAFAFLDPVFSSGVMLALRSGELAADAADAPLTDGDFSAGRFADYGAEFCKRIESMRRLVYAFYDHNFSFREFLKKYPHLAGDVTDCLIGNWLKDFEPMYEAMREFAGNIPAALEHGKPLLADAHAARP
jgi:flavin-dependent dehydrogenase